MSEAASAPQELVIRAGASHGRYLRDLWQYRGLLYFLSWRDLAVRYKQTVVGVLWTVLRPLLTAAAFVIVFNKIAKVQSVADVPYPLMVFAGLIPWTFFATALADSSGSVVNNAHIVGKVYFPRIIVPIGSIIVSAIDTLVTLVVFALMMVVFRFSPDWRICLLPFLLVLTFFAAAGPGILLAALNVRYRDIRFLVPFIVQFGLYVTPIGFPLSQVPEKFRTLYWVLNPLVPIVETFRWSLLRGNGDFKPIALAWSCFVILGIGIVSVMHFRRIERSIADDI